MTKTKKESKTPLKDKVEEDFKKIEEKAASFALSVTETCEVTARVIERWQKSHPEAKERIRTLLFHLTNDTFYVTFETREQSVEKARQFLRRGIK